MSAPGLRGLRRPEAQHGAGRRSLESALVVAVLIAAGAMLLYLQRGNTFFRDEWSFVLYRQGGSLDSYLAPHAGNLVLLPALLYVGTFEWFGLDDPEVLRVIHVGITLLCGWLVYRWARRHFAAWVAVLPMVSVLSFGPGWDDLLWPFQIGYSISLAAGVGSLILLERDRTRSDAGAAALVAIAVGASSVGLAFVASALAMVLARRRRQPWTLALLALPVLAWFVWYRSYATADARFHPANLAEAPALAFESASSATGALTALGGTAGPVLLFALLALVIRRVLAEGTLSTALAGAIAFGIAFWTLISLAPLPGSAPDESRYLLPGAVAVLLVIIELSRGSTLPRLWSVALVSVFALAVVSNLATLRNASVQMRGTSSEAEAELAAIEVAGPNLVAGHRADVSGFNIDGAAYLGAVRYWKSSPASRRSGLSAAQRTAFDAALLAAEGITGRPSARPPASADCEVVPRRGLRVPPARQRSVIVRSLGKSTLEVRRLGDTPTTLARLSPHRAVILKFPRDGLRRPWTLSARRSRSTSVCSLSSG